MSNTYLVSETSNGQEEVVAEFQKVQDAYRYLGDYSEEDKDLLSPCVYRKFPDGTITTDF